MLLAGAAIYWSDPTCNAIIHWKSPSEKCLFTQKLGPNLSKMEVRTFVSIMKLIWDQLLAFRVLIIEKNAFLNLYVMPCTPWESRINYRLVALSRSVFCVVLFCSPSRSFFRLNHLRKVRKRCSHSIFSSPAIITKPSPVLCWCFSVTMGVLSCVNKVKWSHKENSNSRFSSVMWSKLKIATVQ